MCLCVKESTVDKERAFSLEHVFSFVLLMKCVFSPKYPAELFVSKST